MEGCIGKDSVVEHAVADRSNIIPLQVPRAFDGIAKEILLQRKNNRGWRNNITSLQASQTSRCLCKFRGGAFFQVGRLAGECRVHCHKHLKSRSSVAVISPLYSSIKRVEAKDEEVYELQVPLSWRWYCELWHLVHERR